MEYPAIDYLEPVPPTDTEASKPTAGILAEPSQQMLWRTFPGVPGDKHVNVDDNIYKTFEQYGLKELESNADPTPDILSLQVGIKQSGPGRPALRFYVTRDPNGQSQIFTQSINNNLMIIR